MRRKTLLVSVLVLLLFFAAEPLMLARDVKASAATYAIFTEDFEGAWPGSWICGDFGFPPGCQNYAWALYWGRTYSTEHTGSCSAWCAQVGDHDWGPDWIDSDMQAYMYRTVSLNAYGSVELRFWYEADYEPLNDVLDVIYRIGTCWKHVTVDNTGYTPMWTYCSISIPTTANAVGFFFFSNFGKHCSVGYRGAYVDDVELIGIGYDVTVQSWDYESGWLPWSVPITMDGWPTGYDTPHTFTGLIGTHNFTVPSLNPAYHMFADWDTWWTDETITVSSGGTFTARYRAGYTATIWGWNPLGWDPYLPITMDGVSTGWTTPQTIAGLTGVHNITVPSTNSVGQVFNGWSGCNGWNTYSEGTTLTFGNAGVYTACYGPPIIIMKCKIHVKLNSGADLHIYDQQGRHVGYNYDTQQNEIQIPGATYTGREEEPQIIAVPLTEGLTYAIEVVGTTGGPYKLVVDVATPDDVVVAERSFDGTTSPRQVFPYSAEVVSSAGPLLSVQPMVSLTTSLEIGQPKYGMGTDIFVTLDTPFTMHTIGGSGVVSTTYRIFEDAYDSGWTDYTEPFQILGLADGAYSINYTSSDTSGNLENVHTIGVILDNTPPTTTPTIGYPEYVSGRTYVTPDTLFTLKATDTGSGVSLVTYRINSTSYDSGWLTYTAPFQLTSLTDGTYTIEFNSTDNVQNTETTHAISVTLFHWNYIYQDTYGRGTTLKINPAYKFFQFTTPDKDYGITKATYMKQCGRAIIIDHCDKQLRLITVSVDTKIDFCYTMAWDLQRRKCYLLIDKLGIEE